MSSRLKVHADLTGPQLCDVGAAKIKYGIQTATDEDSVNQFTEPDPRHHIMDNVGHLDAAGHGVKAVLMKPEAKRPDTLLVDKAMQRNDVLDLSYPGHGNAGHCGNLVSNDQA